MNYDLTIVIPCYNEERRLAIALTKLLNFRHLSPIGYEVVLVDNASIDNTRRFIDYYAGRYRWVRGVYLDQRGKGLAVAAGMLAARAPLCYMADVDFSTPLGDLPKFLNSIHDYDIVIGSREIDRVQVKTSFRRRVIGRVFHAVVHGLSPGIRDTQCGFKMFRAGAAADLFSRLKLSGFAFDVELLYLARRRGYNVREIPVRWTEDKESRINLVRDSVQMLVDVLSIPLLHPSVEKLPA